MRALVLHPIHASVKKPGDAGEFKREALRFASQFPAPGGRIVPFNNALGKGARRREVERAIASGGPWDVIALFSHGLKLSIQTGHGVEHVGQLADVIVAHAAPHLRVELYACDAARDEDADRHDDVTEAVGGDGGFADQLRDALAARGLTGHVDAHAKPGHTTRNPHLRRFSMDGGPGVGGEWLVSPTVPEDATPAEAAAVRALWRSWSNALKGSLRHRFGLMTREEIERELTS